MEKIDYAIIRLNEMSMCNKKQKQVQSLEDGIIIVNTVIKEIERGEYL